MTTPWLHIVVTWALVLGGWYVVHCATLARERRKERREVAKSAVDAIGVLATEAREFHIASAFDPFKADTLRYKTEKLIRSLQRPPLRYLDLPIGKMVRLRKAITLHNADASSFVAQDTQSAILQEIRTAVDDIIDAIEIAREAHWE